MTARLSRRGMGKLLAAATASAGFSAGDALSAVPRTRLPPDARLAEIARELLGLDNRFAALPEDDPRCQHVVDSMDELLAEAAAVQPVSDAGYAVKARLAQKYGDSCRAGEMLTRYLLCDLMLRGGWTA